MKEIESVIKDFSRNKSLGPNSFMSEYYQTVKEVMIIFLKIFPPKLTLQVLPDTKTRQGHHKKITGQHPV